MDNEQQIGLKLDQGKAMLSLIPPSLIFEVGKVLTFGAQKYAPNNWKYVENAEERYKDALLRHLFSYLDGEETDSETGFSHLSHVATNVAFLIEFQQKKSK
jgi:hypothetical protein